MTSLFSKISLTSVPSNSYRQRKGHVILVVRLGSSREVSVSTHTEDQGFIVSSFLFLKNCDSLRFSSDITNILVKTGWPAGVSEPLSPRSPHCNSVLTSIKPKCKTVGECYLPGTSTDFPTGHSSVYTDLSCSSLEASGEK